MAAPIRTHVKLRSLSFCVKQFLQLRVHQRRFSTSVTRLVLDLHERGLFQTVFPDVRHKEFQNLLKTPQTVYCGFDPTADSLHIGNLLAIIALIQFQRRGHQPIAVIGGATAQIGDPSGRSTERDKMDINSVEENTELLTDSLYRMFRYHQNFIWKDKDKKLPEVRIMNNVDWYKDKNVIKFLSSIGRKFRMGQMLSRHSVQTRLASEEGMSLTEFTYQMFQSYDWLHLLMRHKCTIQIGGNDQLGNIVAGYELIGKEMDHQQVFAVTVPLVTASSGEKLGKSRGNSLWLDPNKTTPYELYQHFLNLEDAEVEKYLKLFTFLTNEEIGDVMKKQLENPASRIGQKTVAEQVTLLVHGGVGLHEAKKWTEAFFSGDPQAIAKLSKKEVQQLFKSAKTVEIFLEPGVSVLDVVMGSKMFNRTVDAMRVIKAGGVTMNHSKVTDPHALPIKGIHILANEITLLRVGKKNYTVVKWIK